MGTESVDPNYRLMDTWRTDTIVTRLLDAHREATRAVMLGSDAITSAANVMADRLKHHPHGRIVYAGAGTSGRLAVGDGAELYPTFGWPKEQFLFFMAGGEEALHTSVEGAEDRSLHGQQLVEAHELNSADVLISVTASGTTPFAVACLEAAKERGALTIGIANNDRTPLLREADCPIFLDTGAEPIAGSTRMKAGTAQRIALNTLSSAVMVLLGGVYEGEMVGVQRMSAKLGRRSIRIVSRLANVNAGAAEELLRKGGAVKTAIVMARGYKRLHAEALLRSHDHDLRKALQLIEGSRQK